jgi:hypothetical protein
MLPLPCPPGLRQVKWDGGDGQKETIDWYATGYLTNYFLSLAPDSLQPEFPEDGTDDRIAQLEEVFFLNVLPQCFALV